MLKRIALPLAFTLQATAPALVANTIAPANLKKMLETKPELILVGAVGTLLAAHFFNSVLFHIF